MKEREGARVVLMNIKIISVEDFDRKRAAIAAVPLHTKYVFPDRQCTLAEQARQEQSELRSLLTLVTDIDLAGSNPVHELEPLLSFFDEPVFDNAKGREGLEIGKRAEVALLH